MTIEEQRYERDTQDHIRKVRDWMRKAAFNLEDRTHAHDDSKLEEPEMSAFMRMMRENPLSGLEYGGPEYMAALEANPDAILHHWHANDHHPEYWLTHTPAHASASAIENDRVKNGACISAMSLLSLLEMLCDWKAATERMKDGSLEQSFRVNAERFGIDGQLLAILHNTAIELGMVE